MASGIKLNEISYIEDYSRGRGGQCELRFTPVTSETQEKDILISSKDSLDDTIHNYSINQEDWELIKRMVDNHFKNKKEG